MTRDDYTPPPHSQHDLDELRRSIVVEANQVIIERIPATATTSLRAMDALAASLSQLDAMIADNEAWRAKRRQRALNTPIHIVIEGDDRETICGADTTRVPYGLGRPEHLARWRAAGQVLCPDCEAGLGST